MAARIFLICVYLMLAATASWGGRPFEEAKVCPLGGKEFTVTATTSCSVMGRTLSLRPITSCDFVTRLPVCPDNGLPLYQEFSEEQLQNLDAFSATKEYEFLLQLPPWQRAYGVSRHLGQSGTTLSFNLLLKAVWYEWEEFFRSPTALDQFLSEAKSEVKRISEPDKPFLEAVVAYVLTAAERHGEAKVWLEKASQSTEQSEYLKQYTSAVRACLGNAHRKGCGPLDTLNDVQPSRTSQTDQLPFMTLKKIEEALTPRP